MVKEALAQRVSVESLIQVKGMTFQASEIRNSWAVYVLNKLFSFHLMYRKLVKNSTESNIKTIKENLI